MLEAFRAVPPLPPTVRVRLRSGGERTGELLGFSAGTLILVEADGAVVTVPRGELTEATDVRRLVSSLNECNSYKNYF